MKAPVWDIMMDMDYAGGVAALGPMRRLSARLAPIPLALPSGIGITSAYVVPTDVLGRIEPGRGNQLRGSARDSQTNFT